MKRNLFAWSTLFSHTFTMAQSFRHYAFWKFGRMRSHFSKIHKIIFFFSHNLFNDDSNRKREYSNEIGSYEALESLFKYIRIKIANGFIRNESLKFKIGHAAWRGGRTYKCTTRTTTNRTDFSSMENGDAGS